MIIPIPTEYNSRHLADRAYKASDDWKSGSITLDEAYHEFDLFGEVCNRLDKRHEGAQ